jgi:K+/H+ antiporter YhaU regulatory subunit KhtT
MTIEKRLKGLVTAADWDTGNGAMVKISVDDSGNRIPVYVSESEMEELMSSKELVVEINIFTE